MPRVTPYTPDATAPGTISSGAIASIASTPSLGDGFAKAIEPVRDYLVKTETQRLQTDTMAKMAQFEVNARQRLSQLQESDLGDQNISDVYLGEMDKGLSDLRSSVNPYMRDFYDEQAVRLHTSIANEAIMAQSAQNAARVKQSAADFTDAMQKMAVNDPHNVTQYANQVHQFASALAVDGPTKDKFARSAIDSVYDAQAAYLSSTHPDEFAALYNNGFYNDKVSAEQLAKITGYRSKAASVFSSRASLASAQATMPGQLDPVIRGVESSDLLDEKTKNQILTQLYTAKKGMMADVIAQNKSYQRGAQILSGELPYDASNSKDTAAINAVYQNQRAAVMQQYELPPDANDIQRNDANQKMQNALTDLTVSYVKNYNILPHAAVAEIARKLGNYSDPAAINQGMQEIENLAKKTPVVVSNLPKEMQDDYNTYQLYADKFGNDGGQAADRLISLKKMTIDQKVDEKKLRDDADTAATQAWTNAITRTGIQQPSSSILTLGTATVGNPGSFLDWTLGSVVREGQSLATAITDPSVGWLGRTFLQDKNSPDLAWMASRFKQAYRNAYVQTKGTEPIAAQRVAEKTVQEEFGTTAMTRGRFNLGNAEMPTLDVMWMPPEKVLEMRGIKSPEILSREGRDWDVIKKALEQEMRYSQEPLVDKSGAPMLDAQGHPKYQTIDLWQRLGIQLDLDKQQIRLTTTPVDKQTKTAAEFAAHPVYGMEYLDANNIWQPVTNGKGQPMYIDFNKVIKAIKNTREGK